MTVCAGMHASVCVRATVQIRECVCMFCVCLACVIVCAFFLYAVYDVIYLKEFVMTSYNC